jgi:hypothetical protein
MKERYIMNNQIENLIENIKQDYLRWTSRDFTRELSETNIKMVDEFNEGLTYQEGRKYIKILSRGSVWGFIVKGNDKLFKAGDILKAAGYNSPARNKARGNIIDGGYSVAWTGPHYL